MIIEEEYWSRKPHDEFVGSDVDALVDGIPFSVQIVTGIADSTHVHEDEAGEVGSVEIEEGV